MKRRVKAWALIYAKMPLAPLLINRTPSHVRRLAFLSGGRLLACEITIEYDDGKKPAKGKAKR